MGSEHDQGGRDNQDITEETDAYYQDENNSGSGNTILYGLFALVVTLIIAAGLFFGGRAVYRALTGTSSDEGTSSPQEEQTSNDTEDSDNAGQAGSDQTPGVSSDTSTDGSVNSENNQGNSDGTSSDMPSTGDNLPATGSPTGI